MLVVNLLWLALLTWGKKVKRTVLYVVLKKLCCMLINKLDNFLLQMDRKWMYGDRCSMAWINGLKSFLDAAESNRSSEGFICCPCRICKNNKEFFKKTVFTSTYVKMVSWLTILCGPSTVSLEL